jgi:hypothetical protein
MKGRDAMNDADYNQLRELGWRRKLTAVETARLQEHLAAHPELRDEWEAEAGLTRLLDHLPDAAPVSSNFTSLVMQAVQRETAASRHPQHAGWRRWRILPHWLQRTAVACLVLGVSFFAYHEHRVEAREAMGKRVATLAGAVSATGPEVIEHFDSICRLSDAPPKADTELLASMK